MQPENSSIVLRIFKTIIGHIGRCISTYTTTWLTVGTIKKSTLFPQRDGHAHQCLWDVH